MKIQLKNLVLALLGLSLFLNACKKEEVTENETTKVEQAKQLTYKPEYESLNVPLSEVKPRIDKLLTTFKNNTQLNTRSSELVPVAEAIWDIEALSNATEANAKWSYKKMRVYTSTMSLSTILENGTKKVDLQEVAAKYGEAVAKVLEAETNTNYPVPNRQAIYIDVVPFEDASGNVVVEMNIGVGLDPESCPTCPIGDDYVSLQGCTTTDCWKAGFKQGTCNNPPSSVNINLDASDIIESHILAATQDGNCPTQIVLPPNAPRGYFVNLKLSPRIVPDNFPNPDFWQSGPYYKRYRLYKSRAFDPGGFVDCLSPADITHFRHQAEWIINATRVSQSPIWLDLWQGDKYFVDCNLSYEFLTNGTQNLEHHLWFRVGNYIE